MNVEEYRLPNNLLTYSTESLPEYTSVAIDHPSDPPNIISVQRRPLLDRETEFKPDNLSPQIILGKISLMKIYTMSEDEISYNFLADFRFMQDSFIEECSINEFNDEDLYTPYNYSPNGMNGIYEIRKNIDEFYVKIAGFIVPRISAWDRMGKTPDPGLIIGPEKLDPYLQELRNWSDEKWLEQYPLDNHN